MDDDAGVLSLFIADFAQAAFACAGSINRSNDFRHNRLPLLAEVMGAVVPARAEGRADMQDFGQIMSHGSAQVILIIRPELCRL